MKTSVQWGLCKQEVELKKKCIAFHDLPFFRPSVKAPQIFMHWTTLSTDASQTVNKMNAVLKYKDSEKICSVILDSHMQLYSLTVTFLFLHVSAHFLNQEC